MKLKKIFSSFVFLSLLSATLIFFRLSFADEVYLKNEDRVSGQIIHETDQELVVRSDALGALVIKKEFVERIVRSDDCAEEKVFTQKNQSEIHETAKPIEKIWKREFSFGYSMAQGNTERQRAAGRLYLNRKTAVNELTLKADHVYSSTNDKMDTQRFNGMLRYAFSFASDLKWYNFYSVEGNHDRFANIDSRITPFTGLGYWFLTRERIKFLVELGVGFEHTRYMDATESNQRNIITPRVFAEKTLWGKSKISLDVALFLSPEDTSDYRFHGETALTAPLDQQWSLRMSLIDDFNNVPSGTAKKNDLRLISSLVYSF